MMFHAQRSPQRFVVLAAAAFLVVLLPATATAQVTTMTGRTSGGAHYRIDVPNGWVPADGLVIWNHGFSLDPVGPLDAGDLGPLAPLQLSEGYAVAASSYSLSGWAVFETVADNREMVRAFEAAWGVPQQVFVTGASLGGLVTVQGVERGGLGNVVGALPICGALAGSRLWDGAVDLRLTYDAVCGDVPGAAIPGGANGLPLPPPPSFDQNALAQAVHACTGIFGGATAEQTARLATLLAVTGLPVEFLLTDMGFATFGLADLVYHPRKLGGAQAFENVDVDYGDPLINATIERVVADPGARHRLFRNYVPTGQVGNTKIVSLQTDKDGLVIVENESYYSELVPPGQLTVGIVVEDTPSHCGFSSGEVVAGWESLRAWVAGAPQPTAQTLENTCAGLVAGGLAEGPCRIDPDFVLPPLRDRVRPRGACTGDAETLCLDDRFAVQATFHTPHAGAGQAQAGAIQTTNSGSFWFFDPTNIELTVKALDGRRGNGHFWIFYGSLTNVEFELTVTDSETGLVKVYDNPAGTMASVGDTTAF